VSDRRAPHGGKPGTAVRAAALAGCLAACAFALWRAPLAPAARGAAVGRWNQRAGRAASAAQTAAAVRSMREAARLIARAKADAGVEPDPTAGPDPSGLIGGELTPLVTTVGSLEAKRTAVDPAWAAALTRQIASRGIVRGDLVAAGFSGSFPGLNLAVMAAASALGAEVAAVSSVTASTWGANQPGFTWPEMEVRIVRAGVLPRASVAVSAGGDGDLALDLTADGRTLAWTIRDAAARDLEIPALVPSGIHDAVAGRMALYRRAANGRRIALYVNVGGTAASLGSSAAVLRLRSGFLPPGPFDRSNERGVMARFAEQGVSVLTLLNVRDLALRWGIPLG
jgi:poly-gamma-glutamate system protein